MEILAIKIVALLLDVTVLYGVIKLSRCCVWLVWFVPEADRNLFLHLS